MKFPVIAIGLEAADPVLIEKWCEEGHLPTLASLREQWPWFTLFSTTEVGSGSTWPSIFTGVSPAKHGMGFSYRQLRTGTYQLRRMYDEELNRQPFWQHLRNPAIRTVIFDVPRASPMQGLPSTELIRWGTDFVSGIRSSWPPDAISQIIGRYGRHPLEGWYEQRPTTQAGWDELYHKLLSSLETRLLILKELFQEKKVDLFFGVFPESHWTGHLFWHLMDVTHPDHRTDQARLFGNTMLAIYKKLDSTLSEIIRMTPEATILIFSNTGMGPNYGASPLLPDILRRLGMAGINPQKVQTASSLSARLLPAKQWGAYSIKKMETMLPLPVVQQLRNLIPRPLWDRWTRRLLQIGSGWKQSLAFAVPSDYAGLIRINLKGREPHGLVEPGNEYDELCEELTRELNALTNSDTGQKVVSQVFRVNKLYQGENLWDLPDLIVRWAGDAPIRSLRSPRIGETCEMLPDTRSGAHRPYGFFLASGQPIQTGKRVSEGSIMDIAPTILYLLGEPIPTDMDGKVLLDMIDKDFQSHHTPKYM